MGVKINSLCYPETKWLKIRNLFVWASKSCRSELPVFFFKTLSHLSSSSQLNLLHFSLQIFGSFTCRTSTLAFHLWEDCFYSVSHNYLSSCYRWVDWPCKNAIILFFLHTFSVHPCGFVQDVHRHGAVTSEANGKCSALAFISKMTFMWQIIDLSSDQTSAAVSHSHSQQRTTNISQTHPPARHRFGPTLGLIITYFISSSSAPSPLDPGGPGWANLLHPFAGGSPSEEIKRYVSGRRVGTLQWRGGVDCPVGQDGTNHTGIN